MADKIPNHNPGNRRQQKRSVDMRPSSTQRGYGASWQRLRLMILRREPLCRMCGAAAVAVDHIIPLKQGGKNTEENLQALCHSCHSKKTLSDGSHRRQ